MTFDIILVFSILLCVIVLFTTDRIRIDLVAVLGMLALMLKQSPVLVIRRSY